MSDIFLFMYFIDQFQAGFFGGQGFVLQKLEGKGDVLLQAGGTLIRKDLKHGENVRISAGCLVAFSATVSYDVEMIPGFNNVVFGGEGLFVTTLKGPGIVWLQGMPSDRFISEIVRRVPVGGIGLGIPLPMGREGGGVATSPVDDSVVPENGTESVSAVATTDTAVEADRQATVATSGPMDSRSVDAESPNALFGDATPMSGLASQDGFSDVFSNEISSFDETKIDSSGIDSSDETTFSTDDALGTDFHDDNTSFSSLYGSDSVGNGIAEDVKSTTDRLLRKLWEMFNGEA
jgi:Mitochondrial biogenesis AIM24